MSWVAGSRGFSAGNVASLDTGSITVAGSNLYGNVLVYSGAGTPISATSVVLDPSGVNQGFTARQAAVTFNTNFEGRPWYLIGPSGFTSKIVRATWASNQDETMLLADFYDGVDQSTGHRSVPTPAQGTGQSTSLSVTSVSGDTVIGQALWGISIPVLTTVTSSLMTIRQKVEGPDIGQYEACAQGDTTASGTSTNIGADVGGTGSPVYLVFGAALIPAAAASPVPARQRRQAKLLQYVGPVRRRHARIALASAPAASTSATGRAGPRGDATASHGVLSPATGLAGALGAAPAAKAAALGADGRVGPRGDASASKAVTATADGRLSARGSVVSAEGAVHGATGRAGALGSVATVPGFGAVTQATGRAGATGAAPSAKESQSSASGRVGATGTVIAAKGLSVQADGRAGARAESAASKAALHGASGSLAARGAALSAEGAVHSAVGRLGVLASVTTAAAFGLTTIASGRAGARGSASATKAVGADAAGRIGPRADVAAGKATAHPASGRAGLRSAVDTSGIPPIETTAIGRIAVRGNAITISGPASSVSSGSGGIGRLVTPSYRMRPPRRKRREEEERQAGAAVDLAPGPLAGTAVAAASTTGAAPAQPQAPAPANRWRLAREQDLEFETKVLHLI